MKESVNILFFRIALVVVAGVGIYNVYGVMQYHIITLRLLYAQGMPLWHIALSLVMAGILLFPPLILACFLGMFGIDVNRRSVLPMRFIAGIVVSIFIPIWIQGGWFFAIKWFFSHL